MSYEGIVCNIVTREHGNADNLSVGNCSGYQVIVPKSTPYDAKGIFFMADTQLDEEFCLHNNLLRKHPITMEKLGGLLEANRRVRTVKLRGEISEGLWLPISCLDYLGFNSDKLKIGDEVSIVNGVTIARKYETPATIRAMAKNRSDKRCSPKRYPNFHKHYDTNQLRNNLSRIPDGALITITEKLHGTSGRSGNTQYQPERTWLDRLLRRTPALRWEHALGSRNIELKQNSNGIRNYRRKHHERLSLRKGETIYYEIVGWTDSEYSSRIMPQYQLSKNDPVQKSLMKDYDRNVIDFTYGTNVGESEIYVYRITQSNEDGQSIELSWSQIVRRCAELGINTVPLISQFIYDREDGTCLLDKARDLSRLPSSMPNSTIKEGVCVRVEHPLCENTYKYKSFAFCHLEGIKSSDETYVDIESIS